MKSEIIANCRGTVTQIIIGADILQAANVISNTIAGLMFSQTRYRLAVGLLFVKKLSEVQMCKTFLTLLALLFVCTPAAAQEKENASRHIKEGMDKTGGEGSQKKSADLVILHGKVVTMDQRTPVAEALAVRGDRIVAVGSNKQVKKLIGPRTKQIDASGKLVIPGFIESHGHFISLGNSKMILDLTKARSWDEIITQVKAAAEKTPPGNWIIGRGWHQEKWSKKPSPNINGYPTHTRLSKITPKHPVLLRHASGHMSFANAQAMRLAGVDASTKDPAGGQILRSNFGKPIGVFRETASGLVERAHSRSRRSRTPAQLRKDFEKAIRLASDECLENGITSFQDAGSTFSEIRLFKQWASKGKLKVRLWVMVRGGNEEMDRLLDEYFLVGYGNDHLTVRAIKVIFDGALGSHGAWLLEPYDDLPGSTGLNTISLASLRRTAQLAVKHKYQLCVHAIGDRANREVLNTFEQTFRKYPREQSRRWRVEHAQHLHPDDIPRFGKLGVIASMQGVHCTSDAVYVLKRLGIRRASQGAYVWQKLLKSGAIIANGTDAPVEDVNAIDCFYASVTRKLPGDVGFFSDQKMTRMQALKSYTLDASYAAFEEKIKGSLTPGKLADIAILSKDILTIPESEIRSTRILYTIVGGKIAYRK